MTIELKDDSAKNAKKITEEDLKHRTAWYDSHTYFPGRVEKGQLL